MRVVEGERERLPVREGGGFVKAHARLKRIAFLLRAEAETRAEQRPLHQQHQRPVAKRGEVWGSSAGLGLGKGGEPELFVGSGGGGGGRSRARITHARGPRDYRYALRSPLPLLPGISSVPYEG